jgi:hypothetical protein
VHYPVIAERDPEINPTWKRQERLKYTSLAARDREQEILDENQSSSGSDGGLRSSRKYSALKGAAIG